MSKADDNISKKVCDVAGNGSLNEIMVNSKFLPIVPKSLLVQAAEKMIDNIKWCTKISTSKAYVEWRNGIVKRLATDVTLAFFNSMGQEIRDNKSYLNKWLQQIDYSPWIGVIESIKLAGFNFSSKELCERYLQVMFDAKWFPYATWIADYKMLFDMMEILKTSRVSKNRIKRIDRLIFTYYDRNELDNFKRRWRQNVVCPPYMKRILIQSVQAYYRKEYALTVCALASLWEGIIADKVHDQDFKVNCRTKNNLLQLIKNNDFDKIFSDFCETFIYYNCSSPEEVKKDVPGRHAIAHGWYRTYPTRKTALTAILFTDFLIDLKPIPQ